MSDQISPPPAIAARISPGDSAPPGPANPRAHTPGIAPRSLIVYGALFGALMITAAWLWVVVLRGHPAAAWFPAAGAAGDLALGSAVGAGFALAGWMLTGRVAALRRIRALLIRTMDMDSFRWHHALLLGLIAGIPEEILFRGAIQPELGWLLTAVLFGGLHALSRTYFAYATLAGALLGGLTLWRGGLWAAVAAHTVIDAVTFGLLMCYWRKRRSPSPTAR
jgi:hypothetical protein